MSKRPQPIDDLNQKGLDWASDQLASLSLDEQIGQLIHVAAWSDRSDDHRLEILELIKECNIGGLIFFQGSPATQAVLTNEYQAVSKVPLMISIDAEWGLGMRLDGAESFPYQMTLGAVQDVGLIKEMGMAVAKQLKRIGATLNHAPIVDVNTNPNNPVINFRAFGQDKEAVTDRGIAYMEGMQEEYVLACAKHFPGHGDTATDSHKELPFLDKTKEELMETELYPFERMFDAGVGAVMVAHLQIPSLEPTPDRASTLSKSIVTDLLKDEMGFGGLAITDAMDMKAITNHYDIGHADVEALLAGNDILLFVQDVRKAIEAIKEAINDGRISQNEISKRCHKQLLYKFWMKLDTYRPIVIDNILADVNESTYRINNKLYSASLTMLKKEGELPMRAKSNKLAIVAAFADGDKIETGGLSHHTLLKSALGGDDGMPLFEQKMQAYFSDAQVFEVKPGGYTDIDLLSGLHQQEEVVIAIHDVKLKAMDNFGISNELVEFLEPLMITHAVHIVFFGNAYALSKLGDLSRAKSILLSYQENDYTHRYAFEVISGQRKAIGRLPVTIDERWQQGFGL